MTITEALEHLGNRDSILLLSPNGSLYRVYARELQAAAKLSHPTVFGWPLSRFSLFNGF